MASPSDPKAQVMIEPQMIELTATKRPETGDRSPEETRKLNSSPLSPSKTLRLGSRVDLTKDLDKPDYDQFKKTLEETHARNRHKEPYGCAEVWCGVSTGWHKCIDTTRKSELDKFGVGIVHYFRFVKYFTLFFFIATIMSIPSLYFTVDTGRLYNGGTISTNFKDALYMTSLGSIAGGASQCVKASIGENVSFSCLKGTIGSFSTLKYGRVVETASLTCDLFNAYSYDTECNYADASATVLKDAYAQCEGQTSCKKDLTISQNFFNFAANPSQCNPWNPQSTEYDSKKTFFFEILCQNIELELPGGAPISKKNVGWIVASIDAGISGLYIIFLLLLKLFENKTTKHVLGNVDTVASCSIEVRSLPRMTLSKLKAKLWNHFSSIRINGKVVKINVVDVQVAESNYLVSLNSQLGIIQEKKVRKYREFYNKWADKKESSAIDINYDDLLKISHAGGKKSVKDFKKIQKMKQSQNQLESKIQRAKHEKKSHVLAAFVTFEDQIQRDAVYAYFQRSPFTRCCFSICCCGFRGDQNVLDNKYLKVKDAPDPGSIKWTNMNVGTIEKLLRRLISWGITIGLWAASFACMVYVRNEQGDIAIKVKPYKDCSGYEGLSENQVIEDNALGSNGFNLLECYCRENISNAFDGICKDWTLNKVWSESLPYLIVVAVIIINFILQIVFKMLSTFERHRNVTTESISRILKIFVAQALNTGVIILIVNIKFGTTGTPSVLDGIFDDVTPQWYLDVATTLLLTMIVNIISLPVVNIATYFFDGCSRCWDRGCTCNPRKTKKKSQKAWVNLYSGPEFLIELTYARILTIIFVCLLYSANVPLLYASTFLNLVIVYWIDKVYLLQVCQLPKNLDRKLHSMVRRILFIAILLHLGNAVWAYGSPKIFGDSTSVQEAADFLKKLTSDRAPGIFARLLERAVQGQNISLSILFVLVFLFVLVRIFFDSTLKQLAQFCVRKRASRHKESNRYRQKNPYFGSIKHDDLLLEQKFLEMELEQTKDESLRVLLEARLERVKAELLDRGAAQENNSDKFIGIFSYSIKHHPKYRRYFDAKGYVNDDSPLSR